MDESPATWQERQALRIQPYVFNPATLERIRANVRDRCEDRNPKQELHVIWPDLDRDFPQLPDTHGRFEPPTLENEYVIAAALYDACWECHWRSGPKIHPWPDFDVAGNVVLSRDEHLHPARTVEAEEIRERLADPMVLGATAPESLYGSAIYGTVIAKFMEQPNPPASIFVWTLPVEWQWFVAKAIEDVIADLEEVRRTQQSVTHSLDFRSVHWFGFRYTFSAMQAACIKVLWEAWENRTPEVGDAAILEAAGSDAERLPLVFRNHPAWGTMILEGSTKGTHRLAGPAA
jgi:hypothetical protein